MHARVVGVDLGDRKSHYCTLNNLGKVASEGSLPSTPTDFYQQFAKLPPSLIALEVGTHSRWASKVLKTCGHEVVVANTALVRLIHQNTRKSDRFDAKALAKLARVDCELLSGGAAMTLFENTVKLRGFLGKDAEVPPSDGITEDACVVLTLCLESGVWWRPRNEWISDTAWFRIICPGPYFCGFMRGTTQGSYVEVEGISTYATMRI
jgi:Transposase